MKHTLKSLLLGFLCIALATTPVRAEAGQSRVVKRCLVIAAGIAITAGILSPFLASWLRPKPQAESLTQQSKAQSQGDLYLRMMVEGRAGEAIELPANSPLFHLKRPLVVTMMPETHYCPQCYTRAAELPKKSRDVIAYEGPKFVELTAIPESRQVGIGIDSTRDLFNPFLAMKAFIEVREKLRGLPKGATIDLDHETVFSLEFLTGLPSPNIKLAWRDTIRPILVADKKVGPLMLANWDKVIGGEKLDDKLADAILSDGDASLIVLSRLTRYFAVRFSSDPASPEYLKKEWADDLFAMLNEIERGGDGDFELNFTQLNYQYRERILVHNALRTLEFVAQGENNLTLVVGADHAFRMRNLLRTSLAKAGITNVVFRMDAGFLEFDLIKQRELTAAPNSYTRRFFAALRQEAEKKD